MITGVIYDAVTGIGRRIVRASSSELLDMQVQYGEALYQGEFDTEVFYLDPASSFEKTARPVMPCSINKTAIYANGSDSLTISNIPVGALVIHPAGELVIEAGDTSVTWACAEAGEYSFFIMLEPYQTVQYLVTVIEVP